MASDIKPGIYPGVPDAEYRAWPYPSQSQLSMFRDPDLCELEVKDRLENPPEQNDGMRLGCDVEAALDGLAIRPNVQCLPDEIKVRRGKAWDEFREAHPGVEWLPKSEYKEVGEYVTQVESIVASIKRHDIAMRLIGGAQRQVSFVWDAKFIGQTGEEVAHRVKGRLDYWRPGVIADLKTTSYGGQRRVGQWAWWHGWDIQAAMYTDAMRELTGQEQSFYFVVVRTARPFVVTIYNGHNSTNAAGEFLQIGRSAYQVFLEQLAECRRTGVWHGYYEPTNPDSRVLDIQMPTYLA